MISIGAREPRLVYLQSTDTDDPDLLGSGTTPIAYKRGISGQSTAQHGSSVGGIQIFRNRENETLVGANTRGISSMSDISILVFCIVCVNLLRAVVLVVLLMIRRRQNGVIHGELAQAHGIARFAVEARADLCTNASYVPDLEFGDFGANVRHDSSDLMASYERSRYFAGQRGNIEGTL